MASSASRTGGGLHRYCSMCSMCSVFKVSAMLRAANACCIVGTGWLCFGCAGVCSSQDQDEDSEGTLSREVQLSMSNEE